ncbi:MAG TPA: Ig domain-containing protein [Trebonia sp.]|nr:Ig domain-containing protein [Trebonia sp.]
MSFMVAGRRGRLRAAMAAGFGGCLLCGLAIAVPADATATGPVPSLDCVVVSSNGLVTAFFGYTNEAGTSYSLPVGDDNQVFPLSPEQGQPTDFVPGSYPSTFSVTFNPVIFPTLSWILDGQEVDASAASPQCAPGTTAPASGVSATAATLNGVVTPGGLDATYQFEYGTTPAYGSFTTVTDAGSSDTTQLAQAALAGLSPSTTYYFRLDTTSTYSDESDGTFTVTSDGAQQSFTTPAVAVPPPAGLTLITTGLPGGRLGVPYSVALAAVGGTQPYSWHVTGGVLPCGLRLDSKTGVISGRPLVQGTHKVTITVTDSATPARESLTEQYSLSIAR